MIEKVVSKWRFNNYNVDDLSTLIIIFIANDPKKLNEKSSFWAIILFNEIVLVERSCSESENIYFIIKIINVKFNLIKNHF